MFSYINFKKYHFYRNTILKLFITSFYLTKYKYYVKVITFLNNDNNIEVLNQPRFFTVFIVIMINIPEFNMQDGLGHIFLE